MANMANMQTPLSMGGIAGSSMIVSHGIINNLLNNIKTGDYFIDTLIYVIISAFTYAIVQKLSESFGISWIFYYFKQFYSYVRIHYLSRLFGEKKSFTKTCKIKSVTEDKKNSNLYTAVDWFISSNDNINYETEPIIELSHEGDVNQIINELKKIEGNNDDQDKDKIEKLTNIRKRIPRNSYKKIKFNHEDKTYEIFYVYEKEMINIYGDQKREKEIHVITLSATITDESDKFVDPLQLFSDKCMKDWIESLKDSKWKQQFYTNNREGKWIAEDAHNKRKFDNIVLKEGQLEDIRDDIDDFISSEDWYNDCGHSYMRGYLLYGPPGTGKSSFIKGLANYLVRHVNILNLNNVSDDDKLNEVMNNIDYRKSIVVLEDVDRMVSIVIKKQRNNSNNYNSDNQDDDNQNENDAKIEQLQKKVSELTNQLKNNNMSSMNSHMNGMNMMGGMGMINNQINQTSKNQTVECKVTLSGLLNALDGIQNKDGRILIMTTNNPESLDDALIRSGRIDRKICFGYCDSYQFKKFYRLMYRLDDREFNENEINLFNTFDTFERKFSPANIVSLFVKYKRRKDDITSENLLELLSENDIKP